MEIEIETGFVAVIVVIVVVAINMIIIFLSGLLSNGRAAKKTRG